MGEIIDNRVYNFSAGPCTLPLEVLEEAQADLVDYHELGMSLLEMSHRGPEFLALARSSQERLRALLGIGDDYANAPGTQFHAGSWNGSIRLAARTVNNRGLVSLF